MTMGAADEKPAPVEKTAVVQNVAQAAAAQGASAQAASPTG